MSRHGTCVPVGTAAGAPPMTLRGVQLGVAGPPIVPVIIMRFARYRDDRLFPKKNGHLDESPGGPSLKGESRY